MAHYKQTLLLVIRLVRETHLEESGLASFTHRIDSKLIKTSRRGDGGVVIDSLAAVNSPVVVAMIVDISVAIKHKTILTDLLSQSS